MEEPIQKPGMLARIKGIFSPGHEDEEEEGAVYETGARVRPSLRISQQHPYHVSVRREISSIEDARVAADGLKEGSQQIINLEITKPELRERVIDFLSGVVYALEGTVEKIGDHVFLFAPRQAIIDYTPSAGRYRAVE